VSCSEALYTYDEAARATNVLVSKLQKRGIKPGAIVGVCLPRTAELPVVLMAILKSGAMYLPLDPSFPDDRLKLMLEDSGAALVITNQQFAEELGLQESKALILDTADFRSTTAPEIAEVSLSKNHPAYLLYTSGSTGKPKGVVVTHQSVINLLLDLKTKFGIASHDVLLAITTISFDISVLELFLPLITGARVHLATREQSLDAGWLEKTIAETPITYMQATPATWELLLASGWKGNPGLNILCGGEALRIELAERLLKRNLSLWNLYGPTETTIWSTVNKVTTEAFAKARNGIVSIGKPVANTKIYVTDDFGNPSPLGVAGELLISGDGVSLGYLNRPELTTEKFVPNPFGEGLLYKTGDRVIMDDLGDLYFMNRSDYQVKIRGYRIEPGEVETSLLKVEGIKQAVVIARKGVGGDSYLAAYFIADGNVDALPKQELQELLIQRARKTLALTLPDYMIPTSWMMLDDFPLTPNAKVDRKALPDPHSTANLLRNIGDVISFTPTEKIIADVWRNILSLTVVGPDDNFFDLGGHSLLAVRMMVELENKTGIKLPLAVLFSHPTVKELSTMYEAPPQDKLWSPLVTIKKSGNRNPIFFAHGISGNVFKYHLLAQLIDPDQPCYGLQAVGLNGVDKPIRNLREMATYHMKEILKFQPTGPYALAGGSFGGYLAYEIACQLQNAGHEVSLLCLFDAEAASELDFLPKGVKQLKAAQLLTERFVKRAVDFIQADSEKRSHYLQAKLKSNNAGNDLESWLDKHKMVELIGEESAAYFRKVEEACYDALLTYKISRFNGEILLIRAREGYFNNTFAEDLGWSHFVNGNINIQLVQGDHNSIFWEPAVHDLTKVMVKAIGTKTIPKQRK
jgi:amino acid adenylation domain-containing protein